MNKKSLPALFTLSAAERVEVLKGKNPGTTLSVAQKNPVKKIR
jgi:hypothetical protein